MDEPIAYLNGEFLPFSETKLPVSDMGVVHGVSVTEMIRTFRHQPFRLEAHLDRLRNSLEMTGIARMSMLETLPDILTQILTHNTKLISETHDLGIIIFLTAGVNRTYTGNANSSTESTLCVHTFPLPFELWSATYEVGQHLVTPETRQLPTNTVPPAIKSRSRMHWFLANQQATRKAPGATALVLDQTGHLTETSSGNFFLVKNGELLTPSQEHTLAGVSQAFLIELAEQLTIPVCMTDLTPDDLFQADEAMTTSTPYCLFPVTLYESQRVGDGRPGPIFEQLLNAWSEAVGLDIKEQMQLGAKDRWSDRE